MELSKQDTIHVASKMMEYFHEFNRIDDYFRARKIERVKDLPAPLPGFGLEDDMFQTYDMHPMDMEFEVVKLPNETFDAMIEKVASFSPDENPGKTLKLVVKEKNTNTVCGFIRYGSPLINSKPRNDYLGQTPDLDIFNKRAIMGFNIVPVQPFGFNYLGGKLLALLCCSHTAREQLNRKYNSDICLFETTSLYGSTKSSSQYDGLKPYMRYKGLTDSDFTPLLHDDIFHDLNKWFIARNNDKTLVKEDASSRKLKTQQKMISVIKKSLPSQKVVEFQTAIASAKNLTEQKRFYMSTYGFSNSREVILGKEEVLKKADNYDRFEVPSIIEWWKKKASKRYESLRSDSRLRTKLETWNTNPDEIDIIR